MKMEMRMGEMEMEMGKVWKTETETAELLLPLLLRVLAGKGEEGAVVLARPC